MIFWRVRATRLEGRLLKAVKTLVPEHVTQFLNELNL